jgi:hypothetical protein
MSEESAPPEQTPQPDPWVKRLVMALPLGLIIMGALSFVIYFHKKNAAREAHPSKYAAMMRRDLNVEEYRRYLKILDQDIGPRTPDHQGNVEAAQSFIESTLGYDNMGYEVLRRELDKGMAFEAGMKGAKSPGQLVLVCARYDGSHGESVAALFSLAHAVTGSTHRNSLRFFVFDGSGAAVERGKLALYQDWNRKETFDSVITLYITNPGETPVSLGGPVIKLDAPAGDDPKALEVLQNDEGLLQKYGSAAELK